MITLFRYIFQHTELDRMRLCVGNAIQQAKDRVKGVKTELRQVAKRLTEMNCSGSRWGGLQQDEDGNIKVDEVVCTK